MENNKKRNLGVGLAAICQLTLIPMLAMFFEHQSFLQNGYKKIESIKSAIEGDLFFENYQDRNYFNCSSYPATQKKYDKPEDMVQGNIRAQFYRDPVVRYAKGPINFNLLYEMGFSWVVDILENINLGFNNGYLSAKLNLLFFEKNQINANSLFEKLCEQKMDQLEELPSFDNRMDVFLDNKYFFDFVVEERKLLQRDLPKIVSIYENLRIYNYVIGMMVLANIIGLVWGYRCIFQIIEEKYGFKKKLDGKKIDIFISIFLALVFFIIVSMFLGRR